MCVKPNTEDSLKLEVWNILKSAMYSLHTEVELQMETHMAESETTKE